MDSKSNDQVSSFDSPSSLPNPAFLPFSRYYPINTTYTFQSFVDAFKSFKRDFSQAFYFQDGPKLRYLIDSLKVAAGQLNLTELRESCVEMDLRLQQNFTIERHLFRQFLEDFNTALVFCKKSYNRTSTPIN